jgi:hypothetical protein
MADFTIKKIVAREVIDSRGNPTVEADVFTGSASAGLLSLRALRPGLTRPLSSGMATRGTWGRAS